LPPAPDPEKQRRDLGQARQERAAFGGEEFYSFVHEQILSASRKPKVESVVAAVIFGLIGVAKFAQRFPLTAIAICGFLQGLFGGGRRGRW
jgi:hypothetical protein